MFRLVALFCVVALVAHFTSAIEPTGELAKLAKDLHVACSTKASISEEEIGKLKAGVFTGDDKSKNYLFCIYNGAKVIKDEDLDYEIIEKLAPEAIKATARGVLKGCFDKQKDSKLVDKLYNMQKCVFTTSPTHHLIL
ncbi:pheromone-binding protein-related protein 6-like [Diabrotica undecimpunctata]|uniref:pheromone-binding protein-related protein 6-like n=1 Tax=Diabrotica undecimpunctata TaxID=50387 RepID=UPI003B63FBDA